MTGPRHGAARGSLLRVEVARLTARRFIQIIAALAALGFVVLAVLSFINYSKPTAEVLAEAEARRDADLVLFDPAALRTMRASDLHHTSDYTPYEGFKIAGAVRCVWVRGSPVVRDGAFVGRRGHGRFVERSIAR